MNNMILSIGRQFGSGGRIIGKKLAEAFGIPYYDKELITLAAKESGLCPEVFEKADEKASDGLSHAFSLGLSYVGMYMPYTDILSNEGLFKIQSDAIRKLAETESCVIVGRCADYILRDHPRCISFFIHDKLENRLQRVVSRQEITVEQAKELITKTDKSRAAYYDYFTNRTWGMSSTYNLSVDASVLGIDKTVEFMKDFVERKFSTL
ncbi:cytidylate kinase [Parabacteroides sp. PF5-5]|uniref:cytidylate kinase-like family protein n=1 Tax=unclassified Parabacteroides TaxID=2649774 RepID=UPI002474066C|nr:MULTISPECIES: cytidylate kinase-like family protein [unclassified Parabacteroides]MDH6304427.1 cytidylate kinase [Parabacteroides sp. PH5-39]MDH6315420.1 cytidylate kinase [Parabacteroides sp. PF5-13]MDH6319086.1 cytidylate kinase [Parabacteroides sp. PH5-13]MDH6322816.1 cytidylate kinase [Parabacteroides sp. PH5-8]MDH6326612.1 cytidylate kinase [Parabacteroides sp. PH5-41]